MKRFQCPCGQMLHFGNSRCLQCQRTVGYSPDVARLRVLNARDADGLLESVDPPAGQTYRFCANHQHALCDWIIPSDSADSLCLACRLTQVIPNQSFSENRLYWQRLEAAKRYLIHDLIRLDLPVEDRWQDSQRGLVFAFLEDEHTPEGVQQVLTGHASGRITVNIAEADEMRREQARIQLGEAYRTLLGHMRHEIGHYYWMRLIEDSREHLDGFRHRFGDERAPYTEAVQHYYQHGPPPDWATRCISAYAASHPWEDWAETWAHYLHITDALETAEDYGLVAHPGDRDFQTLVGHWNELSQALNALARSLGQRDPYPFVITPAVAEKLAFIHRVIQRSPPTLATSR